MSEDAGPPVKREAGEIPVRTRHRDRRALFVCHWRDPGRKRGHLSFQPGDLPLRSTEGSDVFRSRVIDCTKGEKMKKLTAILLTGIIGISLVCGCSQNGQQAENPPAGAESTTQEDQGEVKEEAKEEPAAETEEAAEEEPDTGDASLDDPGNQDDIGENELLVVSFGTSFNDQRRLSIGGIESALREAFPDYSVRRAFTSQIIIDHVKDRDGEEIDNVKQALDRAVANGVKNLVVVPTHLMNGLEYTDLENELAEYADSFEKVVMGKNLLDTDEDFEAVIDALVNATADADDGETAVCFMGHGTEAESNKVYAKLQDMIRDEGYDDYYIGTVEAKPDVQDILSAIEGKGYKKVFLKPLMVVGGDHANNDMAGDDENSWKSIFEAAGYEVICDTNGLGMLEDIQNIYIDHTEDVMDQIEASADGGDKVASASEMAEIEDVVKPGMTPVFSSDIKPGDYEIRVDSSSSMFKITHCDLSVKKEGMNAKMQMSGTGYLYLFMGTGNEAAAADEKSYISFEEKDGVHYFTVPVEALDKGIAVSAFSKNKEKWYDRTLVFRADSLPAGAGPQKDIYKASDFIKEKGIEDGEYKVDVTLSGGSGKTSVESPAKLVIKEGSATATIVFSSPHYDYVKIGEKTYKPVNKEGNSAFELPVEGFDTQLPIIADTTAMSKPHEIEYTLEFDSKSLH